MKKIIFAIALAVVLIAVAGYQTLAYFTAASDATNTITADTLTIAINEYQLIGAVETLISEGDDGGLGITIKDAVPGDIISKIPKVKNLAGNADAWIRVRVTVTCKSSSGAVIANITPISLDMGADWVLKSGDPTNIWYYNTHNADVLPANTETSALFTGVTFDMVTMNDTYQGAVVTIQLDAQAVQSDHNGATVLLAAGWPALPIII